MWLLSVQGPFAAIAVFGVYSAAAVLYGVFTFRDCPHQAAVLHKVPPLLGPQKSESIIRKALALVQIARVANAAKQS